MKTIFILFFVLLCNLFNCQIVNNYKFLSDILYQDSNFLAKRNIKAIQSSFIGEYKLSLRITDSLKTEQVYKLNYDDSIYLSKFHSEDAIKFLKLRCKDEKIILINEAHNLPQHRIFTNQLIKALSKEGFKYFGAEALSFNDSIFLRKNKIINSDGYYLSEPNYANLINDAFNYGYKVFSYEIDLKEYIDGNSREKAQALNIAKILKLDSSAKIIIHCGYDHLNENFDFNDTKTMAQYLKDFTKINPFTIDQTQLTEKSVKNLESSFFGYFNSSIECVFIDSLGQIFNGFKGNNYYDAMVYHPRTKYKNLRPDWLYHSGKKSYFLDNKIKLLPPYLVFAFNLDSYLKDNLPVDVIYIPNSETKKPLILSRGRYKLVVKNYRNEIQELNL